MIITGSNLELLLRVFESALEAVHTERGHMTSSTPVEIVMELVQYEAEIEALFARASDARMKELMKEQLK